MTDSLNPGQIMRTATAFWESKALLTAVELDLFTTLGGDSLTAGELRGRLSIAERGARDFFDALVALRFLLREGDGPQGRCEAAGFTRFEIIPLVGPTSAAIAFK